MIVRGGPLRHVECHLQGLHCILPDLTILNGYVLEIELAELGVIQLDVGEHLAVERLSNEEHLKIREKGTRFRF